MSLPLDHPELDDFEPVLDRLARTAHTTGEQYMKENGLTPETVNENPKKRKEFIRKCHYGFDLAQRQVGRLAVEYEHKIRALECDVKGLRRTGDPRAEEVEGLTVVLQNRQLVLRRLLDSILYTVLLPDTWIQRRLTSNEEIRGIDPDVIMRTLEIAVERNKADRFRFNIVADLTTVIHYGDLLEIDKSTRKDRQWRLIELKEGKMNELIAAQLLRHESASTEDVISALETAHGHSVAKQARRMVRQQQRLTELDKIIDKGIGIEPYGGGLFVLSRDMVKLKDYNAAIRTAYNQAKVHGAGGASVSDCITIVAIQRAAPEHAIRGAVAHACYHVRNPEASCFLGNLERMSEEFQAMQEQAPIVDLIEANMTTAQATPIFIWKDQEMVLDLLFARVKLFVQFDIEEFFRFAKRKLNVTCSWVTGKENQDLAKDSRIIPGSPNSRGVKVEYPDGATRRLLSGFFARPIVQFATPDDLVKLMQDLPQTLHSTSGS